MGLIQDIENRLLEFIKQLFAPVIRPLQKLWGVIKGFFTAIIDLIPETIALVNLILSEVQAWRSFREDINFSTGVVNLQSVRDRITELIDEIVTGWQSLVALFTDGFKLPLRSVEEATEAVTEVVDAFESFFGSGIKVFLQRIGPTLERAGGKVFEVLALVQAVAEAALKCVREIHDVVQAIKDVRETFETGAGLFLKQNNPRRTVRLEDGTTMKIRLGKLHS